MHHGGKNEHEERARKDQLESRTRVRANGTRFRKKNLIRATFFEW